MSTIKSRSPHCRIKGIKGGQCQKRREVTETVKKTGKEVLATDTAQGVIGAVADKMEEIAVEKADDAAEAVKEKAAGLEVAPPRRHGGPTTGPKTTGCKTGTRKSRASR